MGGSMPTLATRLLGLLGVHNPRSATHVATAGEQRGRGFVVKPHCSKLSEINLRMPCKCASSARTP